MKKLLLMIGFIVLCFGPLKVMAEEVVVQSNSVYGAISIDETPFSSTNPVTTQVYYVTSSPSGYVYMTITPVLNVTSVQIVYSSDALEKVSEVQNSDGSVTVLMKTTNGNAITSKTELFTVVATITDVTKLECEISFSPESLNCAVVGSNYFNTNGMSVSETEYNNSCGNTTPTETPSDEPAEESPQTGSVIPYVAIGGGLVLISLMYLISHKSNKMYRL